MAAFMQYEHDSGVIARWSGGAYIDLGWIDQEGEFHAGECINVYDYAKGEAEITTLSQMERVVDDHLVTCEECGEHGDAEERDGDTLCEHCYEQRMEDDDDEEEDA